jgi:hypothetical protein
MGIIFMARGIFPATVLNKALAIFCRKINMNFKKFFNDPNYIFLFIPVIIFLDTYLSYAQSGYPVSSSNRIFFEGKQTANLNKQNNVIDSYNTRVPAPSGICFDGEFFWISNYAAFRGNNAIYKLNSKSWQIIDSIPSFSRWTSGIAWDGSGLWALEGTSTYFPDISLIKYSPHGVVLKNIRAFYSCYFGGVAWNGTHIYYGINICDVFESKDKSMIYKADPENGAILDSISPPSGNVNSLVFDNNYLWYYDYYTSAIYKITTLGEVVESFAAPGGLLSGLSIAKGYLWCADFQTKQVFQIDIGLAPSIPENLMGLVKDNCIELSWDGKPGEVPLEYRIYRAASNYYGEALHIATHIASTGLENYVDCNAPRGHLYYWVTSVDSNGIESHFSSAVSTQVLPPLPKDYELSQNYPNPFNSSPIINFKLPESAFVTLEIFDITGNKTATLISEYLSAGEYSKKFEASGYQSGVYFYRINVNDFTTTKKFMLLK